MFGGKRLIGTPLDKRRRDHRNLDFTPVGEEESYSHNVSIRQENNFSPLQNRKLSKKYNSPLADHTIHGSSFDNTSHSFDTIESHQQLWKPDLNFLDEINKNRDTDFLSKENHQLLSNGSNPLRQQQDNVSKLQAENINLKVRLATLTRYFGDEPLDKRDIINHNIELKQSLIDMNGKMQSLNLYIKELELANKETVVTHDHEQKYQSLEHDQEVLMAENRDLKKQLQMQQSEVEEIKNGLDMLEHQNDQLSKQNDELENLVDDLQNDKQQASQQVRQSEQDLKEDIRDLNGEISDLQMQLRSKNDTLDEISHELNELKLENRDLEDTVELLKEELKSQSHHKVDPRLEARLHDAMDEIDKLTRQIKRLQTKDLELEREHDTLERHILQLQHQTESDEIKINKLKLKLKELQQEQLRNTSDDEYIQSIERERQSLYDQLISKEERLSKLDRELNSANLELKSLKKNRHNNDDEMIRLQELNDSLQRQIEMLKFDLQKHDQLIRENEDLKLKLSTSSSSSSSKREDRQVNNPYLEQEIKRLTNKNNELQHIVNSMTFTNDSKLDDIIKKNESLKIEIDSKDQEIDKLTMKLREMMKSNKLSVLNEDDEKLEMMKEMSKLKSKLNLVNIEKDNLQEEYSMKLSIIKRQLQNESHSSINESLEAKLQESIRSKEEILIKLSNKQQELDNLILKNEKINRDNKELEKIMFALEDNELKLTKENKQYLKEVNKLKQTCVKLLNKQKLVNDPDLQLKLDNANQEIDILTNKYLQLRKGLTTKINNLENSKQMLKDKLVEISSRPPPQVQRQSHYPSPRSSPAPQSSRMKLNENELKLLKLQNFANQQTIKDLEVYNLILNNSLTKTNEIMKKNIVNIDTKLGLKMGIDIRARPLSFKILLQFVLAGVRIKRRFEELNLNKIYLDGLQKEIKREKLNLI